MSGKVPEGLGAIVANCDANDTRGIPDDPPVLLEHLFATTLPLYYRGECTAYRQLSSTQAQIITTFYGATRFLVDLSPSRLDHWVPGVLLEFKPGINLSGIEPSTLDLDLLFLSAIHLADECENVGVLNTGVQLDNFIAKADCRNKKFRIS